MNVRVADEQLRGHHEDGKSLTYLMAECVFPLRCWHSIKSITGMFCDG